MDQKKEFLELLSEAHYCMSIEMNYERALLLSLFVLTEYIDENYQIKNQLEIKVVYTALLFFKKSLEHIQSGNHHYNVQLLQFKLDHYLKALNIDQNVLTDNKASEIFFQIREQDNNMIKFNNMLSSILTQDMLTIDEIQNVVNEYIEISKQYQNDKKYNSHLLQQQYIVQAIKYMQYFVLNRQTQAEQIYTQLIKLYNICVEKHLILMYNIPKIQYIATILRQNKFFQSSNWVEKYPTQIVNFYQLDNVKILSNIAAETNNVQNKAISLWVETVFQIKEKIQQSDNNIARENSLTRQQTG